MVVRSAKHVLSALALASAAAALPMCNAFSSLENCTSDGDCPADRACEPRAHMCVPRADASAPDASSPDAVPDVTADAPPDAPVPCEALPWGAPVPVAGLESEPVISARLSPDELTMFVSRGVPPSFTDIYTVTRPDTTSPFRVNGPLAVVNEPLTSEFWPTLSADGKLMFFESSRSRVPDDAGVYREEGARIWSASRVNVASDFDKPRLQSLFDVDGPEAAPYLHPSGRSLYFASVSRPGKGQLDVWVAEINTTGVVTDIRNVEGVNSSTDENAPVVTLDERFLYHNRLAADGVQNDIWLSRRTTTQDGFGKSVRVAELSSEDDEYPSWVSDDHCRLYFATSRPLPGRPRADGGAPVFHMWVASRRR